MSYFAKVVDGVVTEVIVAEQDFIDAFCTGTWIQTSYNTRQNVHYDSDGNPDSGTALRGNYASIGYTYDTENDVFYSPKPYASWVMNQTNWTWEAPVPMPEEGGPYTWDEETTSWVNS